MGDTLKFLPDSPVLVEGLEGRSPRFTTRGMVNIRFEGIDALETHLVGPHRELTGAKTLGISPSLTLGSGR